MPTLRLLAASLLASAFFLTAAAQSPATWNPAPLAAAITSPSLLTLGATSKPSTPLFTKPSSFTLKTSRDAPKFDNIYVGNPFKISKDAANDHKLQQVNPAARAKAEAGLKALLQRDRLHPTLLAQNQTACATLRSYNFTKRDLKSSNPTPSTETDCTPLSKGHILDLPATVSKSPTAASILIPGTPK
ncbi:MAG: hypothetical protein WB439_03625 [Acidobacteriaceae bacterium]